jgi:hypothetical protein
MRLVRIEWIDAHGDGGSWMDSDSIKPDVPTCATVGFVQAENDQFICVMQTVGFDGQYYNHLCVPKGMITEMKEL